MSLSRPPQHAIETLPVLALRNSVLFPASVVPINVGRPKSVRVIEQGRGADPFHVVVIAQRGPETDDPTFTDLYAFGTLTRVVKVIRLSSGNYSVVLQGVCRVRVVEPVQRAPILVARVERISEERGIRDVEIDALTAHLREAARKLFSLLPPLPQEVMSILDNAQDPSALADLIASNLPVSATAKQSILETFDLRPRLRSVLDLINRQAEVFRVKKEISTMVEEEMSRSQRELLLRQQLKSIRRELGESEDEEDEIDNLRDRLAKGDLTPEAEKAAKKQLGRMRSMSSSSAEYQQCRTYVEWIADLPWNRTSPDRLDVSEVRRVLDEDHHGLELIKKRIVEFVAVRKLRRDKKGPILCFCGPPGVGKTSLGRSIARAMGRQMVRISLGGVSDESEIRGHRRTYVGAYPGRIISGLKTAASRNPVFILDEIDKLGNDFRGDPASAMLEVLDPEQNFAFLDHYLDVPVDLSNVLFIATANRKDTIPGPLLDRMELIELPGYTQAEKHAIAKSFLVPRQLSEHGLNPERLEFSDDAINAIIDSYTREAGVRTLEKQIASLCRAVAVKVVKGDDVYLEASPEFVTEVLGPARYERQMAERKPTIGVAMGLAWSSAGGDLLFIEATRMPGQGRTHLTGQIGNVMKESVAAAFTYLRSHAGSLGLAEDFLTRADVHVHLPGGGIPKDGPSAGLTIFVALASLFTKIPVRADVAMSGEMTLRGSVLKVDGIKQKCLAAHRAGIKHVILPSKNAADLDEVPADILKDLQIHLVSRVDEVLALALDTALVVQPEREQQLAV